MEAGIEEYEQLYRFIARNGEVHWVEDRTTVEHDERAGVSYNQGILIDITEKKLAEDKLRESEERHRRIVETAGEGFLLMDENLRIVDINDACCPKAESGPRESKSPEGTFPAMKSGATTSTSSGGAKPPKAP
jgi:PAS domain-containing protein